MVFPGVFPGDLKKAPGGPIRRYASLSGDAAVTWCAAAAAGRDRKPQAGGRGASLHVGSRLPGGHVTMSTRWNALRSRWSDAATALLGLFLFVSPWLFGYTETASVAWNAWIVGAVLAIFGAAAVFAFHQWEEWVSGAFGLWLLISPWVLGFTALGAAFWTHFLIGLVTAAFAAWALWQSRSTAASAA